MKKVIVGISAAAAVVGGSFLFCLVPALPRRDPVRRFLRPRR